MGPATLWRTRDGGAHWDPLGIHAFRAGCGVTLPRGGHGTLFAYNLYTPTPDQESLMVSLDSGDTWRTVASGSDAGSGAGPDLVRARFDAIAAGVYRDGTLYAAQPQLDALDGEAISVFSASHDDGRTWAQVESAPDALARQGFLPLGIAPDYGSPQGWLRLMVPDYPAPNAQPPLSPAILQRSDDGGRTWHTIARVGPAATNFGTSEDGIALLTSPDHPDRVCALLDPIGSGMPLSAAADVAHPTPAVWPWPAAVPLARAPALERRGAASLAGPPAPIPHSTVLAASDDGGAMWSAWVVGQHQRDYGGAVQPGLTMDARGGCYVADQVDQFGQSAQNTLLVDRAEPGGGRSIVARLNGQAVGFFGVTAASGDATAPRVFVLAAVYTGSQMNVCQGDVCPPEPPLPRPHLLWTAL